MAATRRTQGERRETTRRALLDATIDCLIENGYAATTTHEIAARAGVSRGARSHHFATKHDLVVEAARHLYLGLTDLYTRAFTDFDPRDQRLETAFELLWSMYIEPRHAAVVELYVAARTDPELRASLEAIAGEHARRVARLARQYFPELAANPRFDVLLDTVVNLLMGLAVRRIVFGDDLTQEAVLQHAMHSVAIEARADLDGRSATDEHG